MNFSTYEDYDNIRSLIRANNIIVRCYESVLDSVITCYLFVLPACQKPIIVQSVHCIRLHRSNWKTRKARTGTGTETETETENWERSSEVIKLATDYRVY